MFLVKGVCMLQGAEFRCGPIALKSAGARVLNKKFICTITAALYGGEHKSAL